MINNWHIWRNTAWYDGGQISVAKSGKYTLRKYGIIRKEHTNYIWGYSKSPLPVIHFVFTGLKH